MGAEELPLHLIPPLFLRSQKEESQGAIVGVIDLGAHIYVYIGPGAQFEDVK